MTRISCRVNLVCRHRSSSATGLACWKADGLFSRSSSSIRVASSMIGLSGGVAIVARWPPNRSPRLHAVAARGPPESADPRNGLTRGRHLAPRDWIGLPPNRSIRRPPAHLERVTSIFMVIMTT